MATRKAVLFLCLGNACRSQMAEGFARRYGSDVVDAYSAGLAPAYSIPDLTYKVMEDRNIDLEEHFPKSLDTWTGVQFDLIVDLSGRDLPAMDTGTAIEEWSVHDPIGESEEVYVQVRDDIEQRVMRLILKLRAETGQTGTTRASQPAGAETPPVVPPPAPTPPEVPPRRRKFLR